MWLKSLDSSQKRSEFVKLARESSYGRLNSATVTAWAIICKYKKAVLSQRWPRNAPIWVPENFQDSLTTPTATIPNIYHGLLYRSTLWMFLQNLKFTVLPVPEIIGGTQKFGQSLWIRPRYIFAQCTVPNFRKQSFISTVNKFLGSRRRLPQTRSSSSTKESLDALALSRSPDYWTIFQVWSYHGLIQRNKNW